MNKSKSMRRRKVLIVDAYSAGAKYAPFFRDLGWSVSHLQTRTTVPKSYLDSFRPADFDRQYQYTPDSIKNLRQEEFDLVFAGIESGVEIADQLCAALGLPGNNPKLSAARRDKWLMSQTVRGAGLRIIRQIRVRSATDMMRWLESENISRFVLKPVNSAGSDSVKVFEDVELARRHLESCLQKTNKIGLINEEFLVQEYIRGAEFAVNSVSFGGHVFISAIWRYSKIVTEAGEFVYDSEELIDPHAPEFAALIEYAKGVIHALEIQHGPSHAEIMVDATGPVLVEIGARIDGIANPVFDREILKDGQHELAVKALIEAVTPEKQNPLGRDRYERLKVACNLSLINHRTGILMRDRIEEWMSRLPTYATHSFKFKVGERMQKTVDIFTSPGVIFLAGRDRAQVLADVAMIREAESKNELYEVKDEPSA